MIDFNKKYWFYLYPHTYVVKKNNFLLLYNTKENDTILTNVNICSDLIKEIYKEENLGVILLHEKYIYNTECVNFIGEAISKNMATLEEIDVNKNKPVVLLPIFSLQRDIEMMQKKEMPSIGDEVINYLSHMNIYLNNSCNQTCLNCDSYYKQTVFCTKSLNNENTNLNPETIASLLFQASNSNTTVVNFLGGNIIQYPYWDELNSIIKKFNYNYFYWLHWRNFLHLNQKTDEIENLKFNILINIPIKDDDIIDFFKENENKKNIKYHFIVENEEQLHLIDDWISIYNIYSFKIIPFFNNENYNFFQENIFLRKEDIFSSTISQQIIFCNQKLNSNNFGILNLLPNGDIMANLNNVVLGNIHYESLLEIIYKEMITKTSWRKTRDMQPCLDCIYQYLCPPPSNYEAIIGRFNLCHIHY